MNKITDRPHTADTGQRSVLRNAPPDRIPDRPRPGRGAISNRNGRFERLRGVAIDDGWRTGRENADAGVDAGADPAPRLDTTVTFDRTKTIIARNDSPDIPFDRSINAYRGCE
ncbi:MAG: radical SAM protein, partial [Rhodospirillaceae bacterium]|nr:radical SAM protein [Rhodospirillaceae bacterium]